MQFTHTRPKQQINPKTPEKINASPRKLNKKKKKQKKKSKSIKYLCFRKHKRLNLFHFFAQVFEQPNGELQIKSCKIPTFHNEISILPLYVLY